MSALIDRLHERIRSEGPITFYEWMKAALYDPEHGYYCRSDRERWGRQGDYRTSPERSVLFAATFARYFATLHEALGSPARLIIAEAGGGDGHFAETVLQTLQGRFREVFTVTDYFFDEASADARSLAMERLASFGGRVQFKRLSGLDRVVPTIVFANELLDAFPVHRVIVQDGKLREFYVGVGEGGSFHWLMGDLSTGRLQELCAGFGTKLEEGQAAEVNLAMADWLVSTYQNISVGFVITVDYGAEAVDLYDGRKRRDGTLRAFHRHKFADDVLANPGEQDITTSVDWTLVKKLGVKNGFDVAVFEGQDKFLLQAGLLDEMEIRAKETRGDSEKLLLRSGAREMVLPGGMAESFQVLVQKKNR
ncbi:MAG: SAM-dependent methyltransferase [Pyrinomonadaceae bacterium]|nr:SAM-dependent methyltransferase [Pyrinomonadaceae bacterium]